MSPDGAVRASNLWKRFRADRPPRAFLDLFQELPSRFDRHQERPQRWRWALRDIDLAIDPGESVGLIGTNGSGKSTLLKILNQIMYPFAGSVEVTGRVGALIDVRSGIHPQLTGRENVYMFGALLGLGRRDVMTRFDEIVGFAELESAIERQVKFYSSGMQMRLGFAVAAFLEPDVLLVDEVLAVGDTTFQQRCLEKMRSVQQGGSTLVLVSHDLSAVEATCGRTVWLHDGVLAGDGPTASVLDAYRASVEAVARADVTTTGPVRIMKVEVAGPDGRGGRTLEPLDLQLTIESDVRRSVRLHVGLTEAVATPVFVVERDLELVAGENDVRCRIHQLPLPRGRFAVWASIVEGGRDVVAWRPVADLDVMGPELVAAPGGVARAAPVVVDAVWVADSLMGLSADLDYAFSIEPLHERMLRAALIRDGRAGERWRAIRREIDLDTFWDGKALDFLPSRVPGAAGRGRRRSGPAAPSRGATASPGIRTSSGSRTSRRPFGPSKPQESRRSC